MAYYILRLFSHHINQSCIHKVHDGQLGVLFEEKGRRLEGLHWAVDGIDAGLVGLHVLWQEGVLGDDEEGTVYKGLVGREPPSCKGCELDCVVVPDDCSDGCGVKDGANGDL